MLILLVGLAVGSFTSLVICFFIAHRKSREFSRELEAINGRHKTLLDHELERQALEHMNEKTRLEGDFQSKIISLESELNALRSISQDKESELVSLRGIKDEYIQLKTKLIEQKNHFESQTLLLNETKNRLFKEFELSAAKLYEEKQKHFIQSGKQSIDAIVSPFKEQIKDFNKRIEDVYHKENTQRNQLLGQITELQKQTLKISEDANNLASALKGDNKLQGSWGEIILERLLEESGLTKGREYETQLTLSDDSGAKLRPDVVIHLPEDKDVIIDSKVSLVDYEKLANEPDVEMQKSLLNAHLDSIKNHIRSLSSKRYESISEIKTLDFVFLFIPIESAYLAALNASPNLFKDAQDKNIVIVSPSSLMVALRIVETIWRYEKQNTNAEKIANSAGKLYDQFVLFVESMETIDTHLNKAQDAYNKSFNRLSQGRGNLVKRIEDLKSLGAKTSRKMPLNLKTDALEQNILDLDTLDKSHLD